MTTIQFFPRFTNTGSGAIKGLPNWITASWLVAVEAGALIEDLRGASAQPELAQALKLRLLEVLWEVEAQLADREKTPEIHALPQLLEWGFAELAEWPGELVAAAFALGQSDAAPVEELWAALLLAFPGKLPDPLTAAGQGDMLRALRTWSNACRAFGRDASFLQPLCMDA